MKYLIPILLFLSISGGAVYGFARPSVPHLQQHSSKELININPSETPTPSETATPTPTPSPKAYQIIKKISETWKDAPSQDIVTAIAISHCESNFHINSKNSESTASGLYQFLDSTWIRVRKWMGESTDLALRFNPDENIQTAYALYTLRRDRGLNPWLEWSCYTKI